MPLINKPKMKLWKLWDLFSFVGFFRVMLIRVTMMVGAFTVTHKLTDAKYTLRIFF